MKKSLTRKLTIAVIALVFAVVSLSTSTYAWFTMSNTAQIDPFQAEVKAGQGIEIAVTAGEDVGTAQWYTGNVPGEIVEAAFQLNGFTKFDALTSIDGKKFYTDKYNKITNATENPVALGAGYVSFYVHIKAAEAGDIYLSNIELSSLEWDKTNQKYVDVVNPWTADAEYSLIDSTKYDVKVGDKVLYEVENAARVFVNDTIYEKAPLAPAPSGENAFVANNTVVNSTELGGFSYFNSKDSKDLVSSNASCPNTIAKIAGTDTNAFAGYRIDNITKDGDIHFQVNIWIEGWDAECLNAIFNQQLSVSLSFELRKTQGN